MRSTGRTLIARIILTVLLLGALIFLIFRLITHDATPKRQVSKAKQTTIAKQKAAENSKAQNKAQTTRPNQLPGDSSAKTPPATGTNPGTVTAPGVGTTPATGIGGSAATQAGSPAAAGKNLANSGPGDVVAIFIGTVAVSSLLYRRFTLARVPARS